MIRLLLGWPVMLVYGLAVMIRNLLYRTGILPRYSPSVKTISIGNLVAGGTGKTPATEYLCRLLMDRRRIAVLSRGYGRKTRGYRTVSVNDSALISGDEPLQLKRKLPELTVAVGESRKSALAILEPAHDLVILDDAFQHRAVKPGLNLLLFEYSTLYENRWLLPAGNYREPFAMRYQADIILVTKAPAALPDAERARARTRLKPFAHQALFFSYLEYGELIRLDEKTVGSPADLADKAIVLLTGIGNPAPLLAELKRYTTEIQHVRYPDHYRFTRENIAKLAKTVAGKTIVTTEKDAQRLRVPELTDEVSGLRIYYLRVSMKIHSADEERFSTMIQSYVDPEHL